MRGFFPFASLKGQNDKQEQRQTSGAKAPFFVALSMPGLKPRPTSEATANATANATTTTTASATATATATATAKYDSNSKYNSNGKSKAKCGGSSPSLRMTSRNKQQQKQLQRQRQIQGFFASLRMTTNNSLGKSNFLRGDRHGTSNGRGWGWVGYRLLAVVRFFQPALLMRRRWLLARTTK